MWGARTGAKHSPCSSHWQHDSKVVPPYSPNSTLRETNRNPRRHSRKCRTAGYGRELVGWKACGQLGRAAARSSRGLVPRLNGTAVYGPVSTVVWDPGANSSREPDWTFIFIVCSRTGFTGLKALLSFLGRLRFC